MRIACTMQLNLKISNLAIRSVLTREPTVWSPYFISSNQMALFIDLFQTYVFLPEDEEECKFECLGQWDGYTIAAMIEDFHIIKFLRNSSL